MDTLYHYCPTPAFQSIIQTQTIWLSSLKLSNDSMEGKQIAVTLRRLAERDGLDKVTLEHLQEILTFVEERSDGLGFCLSEEGDLLSQWRGYAANGTGVSIGFSRAYLKGLLRSARGTNLPYAALNQVEYLPTGHESLLEPTYREVRKSIDNGAFQRTSLQTLLLPRSDQEIEDERRQFEAAYLGLSAALLAYIPKLFFLKASAFHEEKEWRLVSPLLLPRNASVDCLFRVGTDRVIPYQNFELVKSDLSPINEIVLGPKHQTPKNVIEAFLKDHGFGDVQVRRSDSSYR